LSKWRSLLLSAAIAASVHLPLLLPPMDALLASAAHKLQWPKWVLALAITPILTVILYTVLQSSLGVSLYWAWIAVARLVYRVFSGRGPSRFFDEHRLRRYDQKQYEMDISHCIRTSHRIFCVLVSGRTMNSGREQFIPKVIDDLSVADIASKDLRVLLLRPGCEAWLRRTREYGRLVSEDEDQAAGDYRFHFEKTEKRFSQRMAKVGLYERPPSWRMYLFDDRVFVSRYHEPPHADVMAAFYSDDQMYRWFYDEFRELCPPWWCDEEAARNHAMSAQLPAERITRRAHEAYMDRCRRGEEGNADGDWHRAVELLRNELAEQLKSQVLPDRPGTT
jgi:hypothetical protein